MANKTEMLQRMIRLYKEETGVLEVDMKQVALFAKDKGYPLAEPKDPIDLLAKDLAKAAREETHTDGNAPALRASMSPPVSAMPLCG